MDNREKTIIKTSIFGIIANIILVAFKAFVGFIAGSISIVIDALNNLTDAISSVVTIIGTKLANKRPNKKHPYGYGRIEYITASIIAALILFAGDSAIYESVKSIIDYFTTKELKSSFEIYSFIIIGAAILIKVAIGLYFKYQGKKVDSDSLKASGTDALFDSILSLATLIGAILAFTLHIYVEGYLGIIIGIFIIKTGIEILFESISNMIGVRFDKEIVNSIKKDVREIEGVLGAYDLILNSYGHNKNIGSIHISVSDKLTAIQIQELEKKVSGLLFNKYNAIITVGIYAENNDEKSLLVKHELNNITKDYKNILQNHGFYIDEQKKTCSFDLVISFDEENPNQLVDDIRTKLKEKYSEYDYIIQIDQDFSLS